MYTFSTVIEIIDINPYVEVPAEILTSLQQDAAKERGPVPVKGTLKNTLSSEKGKPYIQTVVKFRGLWRLYINGPMLQAAQVNVGDQVTIGIAFDPKPRSVIAPQEFTDALAQDKKAQAAFEKLPPYKQKEFARYLNNLKSEKSLTRNIDKIMRFLNGEKVAGILFYKKSTC